VSKCYCPQPLPHQDCCTPSALRPTAPSLLPTMRSGDGNDAKLHIMSSRQV
jgi:hypothetical protein